MIMNLQKLIQRYSQEIAELEESQDDPRLLADLKSLKQMVEMAMAEADKTC